jgi:hypothetical protein
MPMGMAIDVGLESDGGRPRGEGARARQSEREGAAKRSEARRAAGHMGLHESKRLRRLCNGVCGRVGRVVRNYLDTDFTRYIPANTKRG